MEGDPVLQLVDVVLGHGAVGALADRVHPPVVTHAVLAIMYKRWYIIIKEHV